jgi:serine/threonine kinase 16
LIDLQLGEGGFSFVFLVQERPSGHHHLQQEAKDPSVDHHGDGFFALKKVLIQNNEQLDLVKEEIHVSSYFKHPNLLPLLDHAIIPVKVTPDYKELPPLTSSSLHSATGQNIMQIAQW